jgi:hypothetical protein
MGGGVMRGGRQPLPPLPSIVCALEGCGKSFVPPRYRGVRIYCSVPCAREGYRLRSAALRRRDLKYKEIRKIQRQRLLSPTVRTVRNRAQQGYSNEYRRGGESSVARALLRDTGAL